jgi:hypothetical protein
VFDRHGSVPESWEPVDLGRSGPVVTAGGTAASSSVSRLHTKSISI